MSLYDYLENKYYEEFKEDFNSFEKFVQAFFRTNLYLDGCTYRELLTRDEDVMDEVRMSYKLDNEKRTIEITVL
ncbi:hypothetical protein [Clostridium botulinum]|uniref:hypothetical protein n=1 Tax=Clostridium botulinum TaxID=1491 RepID=UPI001967AEEE|nr:hypothetical protein [Clostridium botulinum]MBN1058600.1 hypothetical protein [Clostridium botulinum]